ncbi:hypothetical protein GCM10007872_00850 [Gluconobacter sphaericus NBRC 12467]|uniref:Uncharacterized protein n=1 Tax=Gluconobacter sphaericus NBRC 12467 TaxID=1307951 RepID=A0AA37SCI1_9PROT|nr:hypothetical protein GSP01_23520 [Gluconobacter sphaericus NBRC 12467]GLQ83177.1 hypothetical protein GCM10007872_00850 [Gluconobacter sphaericus NBRC 12467]
MRTSHIEGWIAYEVIGDEFKIGERNVASADHVEKGRQSRVSAAVELPKENTVTRQADLHQAVRKIS